ncbi:unnamed protein product [Paramecium pentaurelia]|uniref:Uncharacterized protein n=1 Tax=Paramecium pentaurelia TaxID=43138 RepID=A0A8S1VYX7_9CILI|nr:unnamed protein product [Paramecium pentaurelia]
MLRQFCLRFRFCQVINKENIQIYNAISQKIEQQPFKASIVDIWKLSSINLMDNQLWEKTEIQFSKWLNHIDNEDLTKMGFLISKHHQFLSLKAKLQFENRIRKLSKTLTDKQISSLIEKIFPLATENTKTLLIQLFLNQQNMDNLNQMKSLLIILENSKVLLQPIIERLKSISSITEFNNYDEIIIYLQLFYSNLIHNWIALISHREETKTKFNEIIYGNKSNISQSKIDPQLNYLNLDDIYKEINKQSIEDTLEFKRFLAFIQFIRACKYKNVSVKNKVDISQLYQRIILKLTPLEIIQMISELDKIIPIDIQINSLKQYVKTNELQMNNNYYIMFQTANLKYLQSQELSEIFISNIKYTIESFNINTLSELYSLLLKTESTFKELQSMILEMRQKTKDITIKTIQINNSIKINCALQITKLYNLQNETLQILWEKVTIEDLPQVQQILVVLRQYVSHNKLTEDQMNLIQRILRNKFQITQK